MNSTLRLNRFDRNAIFVLILVMIVFAAPLIRVQISASGDYSLRIEQAYDITLGDTSSLLINPPTYSILILLVSIIMPFLGWIMSTIIVSLTFYIFGTIIVYRVLAAALPFRTWRTTMALGVLTLCLIVVQPISLSHLISMSDMLVNWILLSPHHNPTTIAVRVFALPLTLIAVTVFDTHSNFSWKQVVTVLIMVIFATLLKPNWLIAFAPVYGLVIAMAWLRRVVWDRHMVLIGFGLSTLIAFAITFGLGAIANNSTIVMRFFAYEVSPIVLLKIVLSVAFPLFVSIVWREQSRHDLALLLAWAVFAIAIFQGLLFDELGFRAGHHNFLWGQSIAGWVVFVLTVRIYVRQTSTLWQTTIPSVWTWRIATLILIMHTISGLLWWVAHYGLKPVYYG